LCKTLAQQMNSRNSLVLLPPDAFYRLKMADRCVCCWGSAPDPAGELKNAPPDPLARLWGREEKGRVRSSGRMPYLCRRDKKPCKRPRHTASPAPTHRALVYVLCFCRASDEPEIEITASMTSATGDTLLILATRVPDNDQWSVARLRQRGK